jgi:D-sedoheptulose 7-phosphate isomerase
MHMLEQRIQQQFFDSADLQYQSAEALARPVADAAGALLGAITAGGKVMCCGRGAAVVLASHFADLFVGRFERERPGLAALALTPRAALADSAGAEQLHAKQVQALGQPGDVLLLLDAPGADVGTSLAAIRAAHGKDMTVIVVAGPGGAVWRETMIETDVLITVPHERAARVLEFQLLVLHCLCDAVDLQLMGEQDP